jgi:hypothetical protein
MLQMNHLRAVCVHCGRQQRLHRAPVQRAKSCTSRQLRAAATLGSAAGCHIYVFIVAKLQKRSRGLM